MARTLAFQSRVLGIPEHLLKTRKSSWCLRLEGGGCCTSASKKPTRSDVDKSKKKLKSSKKAISKKKSTEAFELSPLQAAVETIKEGMMSEDLVKIMQGLVQLKDADVKDSKDLVSIFIELVILVNEKPKSEAPKSVSAKLGEMLPYITIYLLQKLSDSTRKALSKQLNAKIKQIEDEIDPNIVGGVEIRPYLETFREYVQEGPSTKDWECALKIFQDIGALSTWFLNPLDVPIDSIIKYAGKLLN